MTQYCRRCSRKMPEGGLFYHVKLSAVSGFGGVIDPGDERKVSQALDDIAVRPSEDLEKDLYFEQEVILCPACRKVVIEQFCGQTAIDGSPDKNPGDLLH